MSEILSRLKQAEAERERVIAERRRLESEADAALAEREREEFVRGEQLAARPLAPQQPAQPTLQQSSRLAAAVAMAAALAVVFWIGTLMPRKPAVAPPPVAVTPAPARTPPELFKLERDLEAFASRLKEKT